MHWDEQYNLGVIYKTTIS